MEYIAAWVLAGGALVAIVAVTIELMDANWRKKHQK